MILGTFLSDYAAFGCKWIPAATVGVSAIEKQYVALTVCCTDRPGITNVAVIGGPGSVDIAVVGGP